MSLMVPSTKMSMSRCPTSALSNALSEAPIRLHGRVRFLLGSGKPAGVEFVDCDQDSLDQLVLFLVTRGAAEQDHAEAERWDALQQSLSA